MGKTYKRNQQYRPKKQGKVFNKDQNPWKKNKHIDDKDERPKDFGQEYDFPSDQ